MKARIGRGVKGPFACALLGAFFLAAAPRAEALEPGREIGSVAESLQRLFAKGRHATAWLSAEEEGVERIFEYLAQAHGRAAASSFQVFLWLRGAPKSS
jgi:hypothetical protein